MTDYEPDIDAYAITEDEAEELNKKAAEAMNSSQPVRITSLYGRPVFIESIEEDDD